MGLGTKDRNYDKELASILVHRGKNKKVEITTDDLVRFDGIETIFLDTMQRAVSKGEVKVTGKRALFDLNHPDYVYGAPTMAVVEKLKRVNKKRLAVKWQSPTKVGRFSFCKNTVDDVLIQMDGEDFTEGPEADKAIVALLERIDKSISKTKLATTVGTTENGIKQMIYRINRKYRDATKNDEPLVIFENGYVIKSSVTQVK